MTLFAGRIFKSKSKVLLVTENGKVKIVPLNLWKKYLSKCSTYGYAYLCNRSIILRYGELIIGLVKRDGQPTLEDIDKLASLAEKLSMPYFVIDEAISLIYSRDTLLDFSCMGCDLVQMPKGGLETAQVS